MTVTTPSQAFTESLLSPTGQVNDASVARLFSGSFPISPNGNISIKGKINAVSGVRLMGQTVALHGPNAFSDPTVRQTHAFASSVNSTGLQVGGSIEVTDGGIEIVAAGKTRIAGRLRATRKIQPPAPERPPVQAPDIDIRSKDDIQIDGTTEVIVTSEADAFDGGNIIVFADKNLTVEDGALFSAVAGREGGDGGFIELSARDTVTLGQAEIFLNAPKGRGGTLFIDPEDIVVDSKWPTAAGGGLVHLLADNSITVTGTGIIDSRQLDAFGNTIGDSGNILIEAPTIIIETGAQILADVDDAAFTAGNIALIADDSKRLPTNKATVDTKISVNGILKGANITAHATSAAYSAYTDSALGIFTLGITSAQSALSGLNAGYNAAESTTEILINGNADITASGSVDLYARGIQQAIAPVVGISAGRYVMASVMWGDIDATTKAVVENGAKITAGGDFSVKASNDATLTVSALTIAQSETTADGALAYGKVDVDTTAAINSGANITLTDKGNVHIVAHNDNEFTVKAVTMALGSAKAGLSIAISDTDTDAIAHLGADVGTAANKAGNVVVEATSNTSRNATSSSTAVGDNALVGKLRGGPPLAGVLQSVGSKLKGSQKASQTSSTFKVGSAISVADSRNSAVANISADNGLAAPSIVSDESVAVFAYNRQRGLRSNAQSDIESEQKNPTPDNPQATNTVSAGVAVGEFASDADAYIGEGVSVEAQNIGVASQTRLPITIYDFKWHNTQEVLSNLTSVANANLGIVGNVLTSYANATTRGSGVSIAGAVNYFDLDHNTTAWVARNATLTQSRKTSGAPQSWSVASVPLVNADGATTSRISAWTFDGPVSVMADNRMDSINVGGNFSWLSFIGKTGTIAQGPTATAVGGGINVNTYNIKTVAGIGEGVTVTADDEVIVEAKSDERMISIAPASGRGEGVGGNGILSIANVNSNTSASVSNLASIEAKKLAVVATEAVTVINIGGVLSTQSGVGVGIGVAISDFETDTIAMIGDNSGLINDTRLGSIISPNSGAATTATGNIETEDLDVVATTAADIDTIAIAGSRASDSPTANAAGAAPSAAGQASAAGANAQASNQGQQSTFSLAASGSSAVSVSELTTRASVDGTTITSKVPTGAVDIDINAVSDVEVATASGAAAWNATGNPNSRATALAGALAIGLSDNETTAGLNDTSVTNARSVTVEALAGGEQTTIGLGLALTTSGSVQGSNAFAGSISIAENHDRAAANVSGSSLTGTATSQGAVNVIGYQNTNIGIGAGALYAAGDGGFGLAFTYADI
ncbi:MAG: hypothetical protein AAFO75_03295, partial [Pseudomonadota bacterium]